MKNSLLFFWRKIGWLKIRFRGNQSATLRFFPSPDVIRKGLAQAEGRTQGRVGCKDNT